MMWLRPLALIFLVVVLSGTMWFLSGGIYHVWLLAWLAPIPLLIVLPDLRVGIATVTAFLASSIGALSFVLAYRDLPPVLLVSVTLLFAVPFTLVALTWRALAKRVRPFLAVMAYPALVVTAEYLINVSSPHGTFGSLSYSQGDVPIVIQLASVTGIWGISFILSLLPAALSMAWRHRRKPKAASSLLLVGALPIGLTLIFGVVRLMIAAPGEPVRVGLAVSDRDVDRYFATQDSTEALPVVRAYANRVAALADRGAQVVVLPEKFVGVTSEYSDSVHAILSTTARDRKVMIVAGLNVFNAPERRNVAVVFGAEGNVMLEYDKQHLLPGLEEGYRRGEALGLLRGTVVPTGIAICKDLDFVPLGRAYANAGVGLLLVPAWDFVNDGWLHSRMAVLRGVEGGYALARSATEGLLTVSDDRGRILAERSSHESTDVLLIATVPVSRGGTFYSHTGDWFAWLCLGVVVAGTITAVRSRRLTNY